MRSTPVFSCSLFQSEPFRRPSFPDADHITDWAWSFQKEEGDPPCVGPQGGACRWVGKGRPQNGCSASGIPRGCVQQRIFCAPAAGEQEAQGLWASYTAFGPPLGPDPCLCPLSLPPGIGSPQTRKQLVSVLRGAPPREQPEKRLPGRSSILFSGHWAGVFSSSVKLSVSEIREGTKPAQLPPPLPAS